MALVYALISGGLAIAVLTDYKLVIAALTGSVLMLLSFAYHLRSTAKLKKLDFYTMPVIELQKTINEFKIRSIKAGKYDFAVMLIWLLSVTPVVAKLWLHKTIYIDVQKNPHYLLIGLVVITVLLLLNNKMYHNLYGKKLSQAEDRLQEIMVFEKGRV
jgi:hypothetical protein